MCKLEILDLKESKKKISNYLLDTLNIHVTIVIDWFQNRRKLSEISNYYNMTLVSGTWMFPYLFCSRLVLRRILNTDS